MLEALNMRLEVVRTVLSNDVNEISVCVDTKRNTGAFYTMIAVSDATVRRQLALWIATEEAFTRNRDYLGSFSVQNTMYLLFAYHPERRLTEHYTLYTQTFARRKQLAVSLLAACAQSGFSAQLGEAMLHRRNINLDQDGNVYLNYFLDLKPLQLTTDRYIQRLSQYVFEVLSQEYKEKLQQNMQDYPSELQVYYRKMQNNSFTSLHALLTTVKAMPDVLSVQKRGVFKLVAAAKSAWQWLKRNATTLFVVGLLAVTLSYLGYQIYARVVQSNQAASNISYSGLANIGDVYLGEEVL